MRLPAGWYAVFESSQVSRRRPLAARRFGLDVVAWRDKDGVAAIHHDRCPHRGARLSLGALTADEIVCPFHAFRFGVDGACRWVPELRRGVSRMLVHAFPVREAHGLVWMWWGPAEGADEKPLPWFEDLSEGYAVGGLRARWATHFSRAVENQLDWAHLPYVHRTTIGRFVREDSPAPDVECTPERIAWGASGGGASIEFRFPNIWQNRIQPSFALSLCFVPVDDGQTDLILRSHISSVAARLPFIGRVVLALTGLLNRLILAQDRRVVLSQTPRDSACAHHEMLVGSDRAIRFFRAQMASRGWAWEALPAEGIGRTVDAASGDA